MSQNSEKLPIISIGHSSLGPIDVGQTITVTPQTPNLPGENATAGYTAVIADSDVVELATISSAPGQTNSQGGYSKTAGTTITQGAVVNNTVSAQGTQFRLTGKSLTSAATTTLTITGNATGGSVTVAVSVNANPNA